MYSSGKDEAFPAQLLAPHQTARQCQVWSKTGLHAAIAQCIDTDTAELVNNIIHSIMSKDVYVHERAFML